MPARRARGGREIDREGARECVGPVAAELDEQLDALACDALRRAGDPLRMRLAGKRSGCAGTSRPRRDALLGLITARRGVRDDQQLRAVVDHDPYVEDLPPSSARARGADQRRADQSRRGAVEPPHVYVLSLVAAVFLPLGLLAMNVGGGIPRNQ